MHAQVGHGASLMEYCCDWAPPSGDVAGLSDSLAGKQCFILPPGGVFIATQDTGDQSWVLEKNQVLLNKSWKQKHVWLSW